MPAVGPADKNKTVKRLQYSCSNPNCGKAFSRPKIIKYYVCPKCQTLINMPKKDHSPIHGIAAKVRKPVAPAKPQIAGPDLSQDPRIAKLASIQEASIPEVTIPTTKKQDTVEPPTAIEDVQILEVKPIELNDSQKLIFEEEKTGSSSSSACKYGFGYLSQREKGGEIPSICIECPSSVECMLSGLYTSKEPIKEIKKWYNF